MDLVEIEKKLVEAVAAAKAKGFKLAQGEWGVSLDLSADSDPVWAADASLGPACLCPMGCLILGTKAHYEPDVAAAVMLGCTDKQITNFVVGFDGSDTDVPSNMFEQDEFYRLGVRFRSRVDAVE